MGDPLSRIPALSEIPRNLAILKNMDLDIGADTAEGENETSLRLTSYDNLGLLVNRFIYGEDGHQYPQLRRAEGVLGTNTNSNTKLSTYTKGEDIISVAPGKR